MAGEQVPVLQLDINQENIKRLEELTEKLQAAFNMGPGGFPVPSAGSPGLPTKPQPRIDDDQRDKGQKGDSDFEKFLKNLNKQGQATQKTFGLINRTLRTTTSTLKNLFTETISWGVKIAAISVAGPFGYGLMANRITDQYRTSQSLGVTTGEMQAANSVYGTRISNTDGIMQALAAAQNNPADPLYAGLVGLGINPNDGVTENLPKLLEGVSSLLQQYKGTGQSQTVLNARGLGGAIGVGTANQILANTEQIPGLNRTFEDRSRHLNNSLGDGTMRGYQDVSSQFAYNASRIGNAFLQAVSRLNGPIMKLSDSLTSGIEKFLSGKNGRALFDTLASGLERLANWLGSDQFQKDLDDFSTAVGRIARAIGSAVEWLADYGIKAPPKSLEDARKNSSFDVGQNTNTVGKGDAAPVPSLNGGNESDPSLWGLAKATEKTFSGLADVIFFNKMKNNAVENATRNREENAGFWNFVNAPSPMQVSNDRHSQNILRHHVTKANNAAGLPDGLMPSIAETESSWNPMAVSGSGAKGLFQFIDSTAKGYGLEGNDVFDPEKSTSAAVKYLLDLNRQFSGDVAKMLAQYNGGNKAVTKDGNLNLKKETVDYLLKILPQVQGATDQHPGIMNQLRTASDTLAKSPGNARQTIDLRVTEKPGADYSAQLSGLNLALRGQ